MSGKEQMSLGDFVLDRDIEGKVVGAEQVEQQGEELGIDLDMRPQERH